MSKKKADEKRKLKQYLIPVFISAFVSFVLFYLNLYNIQQWQEKQLYKQKVDSIENNIKNCPLEGINYTFDYYTQLLLFELRSPKAYQNLTKANEILNKLDEKIREICLIPPPPPPPPPNLTKILEEINWTELIE